ncbi:hypothetical protein [Ideonella sp.]|jgi:hypothetical protein|uniref:hypothetical protein n=1 Tax=Ideonella sp. TaxID=1929293 RepID=UPI0037C17267
MYQVTHIHAQPSFTTATVVSTGAELVELDMAALRFAAGGLSAANGGSTELPYRGWSSGGNDSLPYRGW